MDWLLTGGGLLLLLGAGDALVRGAVNTSLRLGVPALIVSLTIVAFGTSAPELLISVQAILDGVPELALGNVVGSNIANVLLVLGVPAIIISMHTSEHDTRDCYLEMMFATLLFIGLAFYGVFLWWSGLILLTALGAILARAGYTARKHKANAVCEDTAVEGADPNLPWTKIIAFLIAGLIGLPLGAALLVEGATNIARTYDVPEAVIGLTLVAIGTSLPELATTIVAALRRQADVAIGNVIGSNMFNLLGIIGVASLVGPIPVAIEFIEFDMWVMMAASLLLIPFVFMRRDLTRIWGIGLTILYAGYLFSLL